MFIEKYMLKLRRGASLVEALTATAILALVTTTTLIALGYGANLIRVMRQVTRDNFVLVEDMELQIREVRILLDEMTSVGVSNTLNLELSEYDIREVHLVGGSGAPLFSQYLNRVNWHNPGVLSSDRDIRVYLLSSDLYPENEFDRLYSFAGPRALRYSSPEVYSLYIEFDRVNRSQPADSPLANVLSIHSSALYAAVREQLEFITEDGNGNDIWGGVNYQWWVSREDRSFGMVLEHDSFSSGHEGDLEWGMRPVFPRDFEQIFGATNTTLPQGLLRSEYRGRHILLSATPFSNLGRMGTVGISNSIILIGVPVTEGLFAYFNAGMVDRVLPGSYIDYVDDRIRVRRWNDIMRPAHANAAVASTEVYSQPILYFEENNQYDDNRRVQFPVMYFNSEAALDAGVSKPYFQLTRSGTADGITIFVVSRQHDVPDSANLIIEGTCGSGDRWTLGFNGFSISHNGEVDASMLPMGAPHSKDEFYVVSGRFGPHPLEAGQAIIRHALNGQQSPAGTIDANDTEINFGTIIIGNNTSASGDFNASIAEILIFNRELSDDDFERVLNYLLSKFDI